MRVKSIGSVFDFVLPRERKLPEPEQTLFKLRYLTLAQETYLDDRVGGVKDDEYKVKMGTKIVDSLHMGINDVLKLYVDNEQSPVKFERDERRKQNTYPGGIRPWKEEHLGLLNKEDRIVISEVVRRESNLEEAEIKNS